MGRLGTSIVAGCRVATTVHKKRADPIFFRSQRVHTQPHRRAGSALSDLPEAKFCKNLDFTSLPKTMIFPAILVAFSAKMIPFWDSKFFDGARGTALFIRAIIINLLL